MQGSAAAVSGRVSFLSGTKLDCGRLSVESGRDEKKRASTIVQHQIPHHSSIPARLVSPEQSREDCDSGAVQVLKSKRCRDTKPSLIDEPEHFRVPGHKTQANKHDSDICLGHQTTEQPLPGILRHRLYLKLVR